MKLRESQRPWIEGDSWGLTAFHEVGAASAEHCLVPLDHQEKHKDHDTSGRLTVGNPFTDASGAGVDLIVGAQGGLESHIVPGYSADPGYIAGHLMVELAPHGHRETAGGDQSAEYRALGGLFISMAILRIVLPGKLDDLLRSGAAGRGAPRRAGGRGGGGARGRV